MSTGDKHNHDHGKPKHAPHVQANVPGADNWPQIQAFLVQIFTADVVGGTNAEDDAAQNAPHADFWKTMTYSQFVKGNVPGVNDPTGAALPILVVGNSQKSNIVMALLGSSGSIFDPNSGAIGQMPANFPAITPAAVQRLAKWIDAGCPQ